LLGIINSEKELEHDRIFLAAEEADLIKWNLK
jgi:hypothetical protein